MGVIDGWMGRGSSKVCGSYHVWPLKDAFGITTVLFDHL